MLGLRAVPMRYRGEPERLGDQLVGAPARRVVVGDRHDEHLVGAVLGGDLLEPGAHGLRRADDDAPARERRPGLARLVEERERLLDRRHRRSAARGAAA